MNFKGFDGRTVLVIVGLIFISITWFIVFLLPVLSTDSNTIDGVDEASAHQDSVVMANSEHGSEEGSSAAVLLRGNWFGIFKNDSIFFDLDHTFIHQTRRTHLSTISRYKVINNTIVFYTPVMDTCLIERLNLNHLRMTPSVKLLEAGLFISHLELQRLEDFNDFISEFNRTDSFQMKRIKFPLDYFSYPYFNDSVVHSKQTLQQWEHHQFGPDSVTAKSMYGGYTNSIERVNRDKVIWDFIGLEGDLRISYTFSRIRTKWYLVKVVNKTP